jgi:hypothetical protein
MRARPAWAGAGLSHLARARLPASCVGTTPTSRASVLWSPAPTVAVGPVATGAGPPRPAFCELRPRGAVAPWAGGRPPAPAGPSRTRRDPCGASLARWGAGRGREPRARSPLSAAPREAEPPVLASLERSSAAPACAGHLRRAALSRRPPVPLEDRPPALEQNAMTSASDESEPTARRPAGPAPSCPAPGRAKASIGIFAAEPVAPPGQRTGPWLPADAVVPGEAGRGDAPPAPIGA